MPSATDTDAFTGVKNSAPAKVKVAVWVLTAVMVLVALIGFDAISGGRGLLMFAVLAALFVIRLVVVSKWQK